MLDFDRRSLDNGVEVLTFDGRLDALTALEVRPTIDELVEQRAKRVVCDMQKLTMVDSSGVGAIVSLFKRLRTLGGDVKIARLNGQPKEIFRLLRLDRVFDVYDDVDTAASKFK